MQPDSSYGNFIIEESLIIRGLEPESNGSAFVGGNRSVTGRIVC